MGLTVGSRSKPAQRCAAILEGCLSAFDRGTSGVILHIPQLSSLGFLRSIDHHAVFLKQALVPVGRVGWVRVRQRANIGQAPKDRVSGEGSFAVLLGHPYSTKALLMLTQVARSSVQEVEYLTELDIFLHNILIEVVHAAYLVEFFRSANGPKALEFGIVQREANGDRPRKQVQRGDGTVVVVDVVEVDGEPFDRLGDAGIPCRVVDGAVEVVHSGWVRFCLGLLPEHRGVQKDKGDVAQSVILNLDAVRFAEDDDIHGLGDPVDGIVHSSHARHNPDQILMAEVFAHQ